MTKFLCMGPDSANGEGDTAAAAQRAAEAALPPAMANGRAYRAAMYEVDMSAYVNAQGVIITPRGRPGPKLLEFILISRKA